MDRRAFNGLRNLLVAEGNLKKGLRICEGEKLLIFITVNMHLRYVKKC
jgi:hypothetical protein